MASSVAQMCNMALGRIGVSATIADITESSTAARACNTFYEATRDRLLAAYPWPWAAKRATLAALTDGERDGWEYAYALPADCLTPRELFPENRAVASKDRRRFVVEYDVTTAKAILLSDEEAPELLYTATFSLNVVGHFPPAFTDALAWALAAELAMPLAVKSDLRVRAEQMANLTLERAIATALNSQEPDAPPDSDFVLARG